MSSPDQSCTMSSPRSDDSESDSMDANAGRLRALARQDFASRIPIDNIDSKHYAVLARAISNVLSTDLALFTYAQVIDGLPTAEVACDRRYPGIFGEHIIEEHLDICPGVLDKARAFCDSFDLSTLAFNPKLVRAYQGAAPYTKVFNTRLIELVAVTLHQIGALLFQDQPMHQGGPHDIERITNWTMPMSPGLGTVYIPPRPTLFSHHAYLDHDIYPEGVADIVGYWAEDRILGGVTVFDRRAEGDEPQYPPNIYFHACRDYVTHRLFQLLSVQQQTLIDFLLADPAEPAACPLPIIGDKKNRVRVDAETSITERFIYRDLWERKPPTRELLRLIARRPLSAFDYF